MLIYAFYNYGPVKSGTSYKKVDSGFDWIAIKNMGRLVYVPSWVFESESNYE